MVSFKLIDQPKLYVSKGFIFPYFPISMIHDLIILMQKPNFIYEIIDIFGKKKLLKRANIPLLCIGHLENTNISQ